MFDFLTIIDSLKGVCKLLDAKDDKTASQYFPFVDKDRLDEIKENRRRNKEQIDRVLFRLDDIFKDYESEQDPDRKKDFEDRIYENLTYILATFSGRGWPMDKIAALILAGADPVSLMQAIAYDEFLEEKKKKNAKDAAEKEAQAEYEKNMRKMLEGIRKNSELYRDTLIKGYTDFYALLAELNHVKSEQKLVGLKINELNTVAAGLKERFIQHIEGHNAKLVELNRLHDRIQQNNLQQQKIQDDKQQLRLLQVEKTNNTHALARLADQIDDAITRHASMESVDALEHDVATKKAVLETVNLTVSQLEYSISALEALVQREDEELTHLPNDEEIARQIVAENAKFSKISDHFAKFFSKNDRELSSLRQTYEQLDARARQLEPQVAEAKRLNDTKAKIMKAMEDHAKSIEDDQEIPEEERISTMVSRDIAAAKQKELELKLKELEGQIREKKNQIEDVKEELSDLDEEIAGHRADGVPEHDFEEEIIKREAKKKTIDVLQVEADKLEAEKNALQTEISRNNANPPDPIAARFGTVANDYGNGYVQPSGAEHGNPVLNGFGTNRTTPQGTQTPSTTNTPNRRPDEEGRDPRLSLHRH